MKLDTDHRWISTPGPDNDVVLSSRARLARNLEGYPFVNRATDEQRAQVLTLLRRALGKTTLRPGMQWIDLESIARRERALLVERHLISAQLAQKAKLRAAAVSDDEALSLMMNEEDHLRMQVLLPGRQPGNAFAAISEVESQLQETLTFAFSARFGYLTACPTNVGTGMRLGVMVHLPGLKLSGEIDRVRRAAKDLHLAVRGFYGEGSESIGDFYQVSNQVTLGVTEEELLEEFEERVVPILIEYERAARRVLMERRLVLLSDRVRRALAVVREARLISLEEAMKLLSRVRLGVHMDLITDLEPATVDNLLPRIQPAHMEQTAGEPLPKDAMKEARATLLRNSLS
ncbi:MAG: ATP--guanido phosphotransferase [Phycisphaerales bacterium]